jgi:hypothetical protein
LHQAQLGFFVQTYRVTNSAGRDIRMKIPSPEMIRARASELAFGSPVIQNNLRALVVEVIVDEALGPGWRWCSGDWYGWDFVHQDGTRLEVKQSAARQTWAAPKSPMPPRFDIRQRAGFYDGAAWYAQPGRHADIYVFACHSIVDDTADHRDPRQWSFYVVRTKSLPVGKTIGLAAVSALAQAVEWSALGRVVEEERSRVPRRTPPEPA